MALERSTPAVASMYRRVRQFSEQTKPWEPALRYHTMPDERLDLTLAAMRAYGSREEFLVIMAAAGLDSVEVPMPEQLLVLPTWDQLLAMKAAAHYQNEARTRNDR